MSWKTDLELRGIPAINEGELPTVIILVLFLAACATPQGNASVTTYRDAKHLLYSEIYYDHPRTLYCGAEFDPKSRVILANVNAFQFHTERAHHVEVEHIVPAENFGRAFTEWREGAPQCVNAKTGNPYKGRKCAETNPEFQRMESDLHNLAPAIGAVNAARKNYRFGMVPEGVQSAFGESCNFKIHDRTVEPPDSVKGLVARTHLYMAATYPKRFRLSRQQQQLFEAWDRMFGPDSWECEREKRIARVQGNRNTFTAKKCGS